MRLFKTNDKINTILKNETFIKHFQLEDEMLKTTPFGEYKILSAAKDFFKAFILENDSDFLYTTETTKTVVDEEATRENKAEFKDSYEKFDLLWAKYKENHADEFKELLAIDNDKNLSLKRVNVSINFSLAEAWDGYQFANRELKRFGKGADEYDLLPKYVQLRSKEEFADLHKAVREELRIKLGLPEDSEVTVKVERTQKMIKRAKASDVGSEEPVREFAVEFVNNFILDM